MTRIACIIICVGSSLGLLLAPGCVSVSTGPGLQEQRRKSLEEYVASLYRARSAEQLAGVDHVSYFVAHGVTDRRIPFIDPARFEVNLPGIDGKPPANVCMLIGLQGLGATNIACLFEGLTYSRGDSCCSTYQLAWDEKRGTWGTLSSAVCQRRAE